MTSFRPLSPGATNVLSEKSPKISYPKSKSTEPFGGHTDYFDTKARICRDASDVDISLTREEVDGEVYSSRTIPLTEMNNVVPLLAQSWLYSRGQFKSVSENSVVYELEVGVDFNSACLTLPANPNDSKRSGRFHKFYGVSESSNIPQPKDKVTVIYLDDNPKTIGIVVDFASSQSNMGLLQTPPGTVSTFSNGVVMENSMMRNLDTSNAKTYGLHACKAPSQKYSAKNYVGSKQRGGCGAQTGAVSFTPIVNGSHKNMMWSPKKRYPAFEPPDSHKLMSARQWGHPILIESITKAVEAAYATSAPHQYQKLYIGDVSYKRGGYMHGHVSHQSGLDIDVGFYTKKPVGASRSKAPPNGIEFKHACKLADRENTRNKFIEFMNKWWDCERNSAFIISLAENENHCRAIWVDGWLIWYMQQKEFNPNFYEKIIKYSGKCKSNCGGLNAIKNTKYNSQKREILSHLKLHANHYHIRFNNPEGHSSLESVGLRNNYPFNPSTSL